ncbi:hypothetical protein MSPP1_000002 [Malassezia sp. CBS 17886]|nr:hypothetical protein MSPP1_000002 [Malassezia sp. CBS 17886]
MTLDEQRACKSYNDEGMAALVQQKAFPPAGKIATIVKGDKEAQSVWKDIQASGLVPSHVRVKDATGDHAAPVLKGYNARKDPDCWWSASGCKRPKHKKLVTDIYECPEPSTWGLTFDDGPNCSHNAFYDFLKKKKLKATMFYIGTNVVNWPLQAQRGIVDGHDLCGHSWSHRAMTTLSNEQAFAELYYTAKAIKTATGVTPSCWRPPYGDVDDRIRGIAAGLGLRTILWTADTDDWNIKPLGHKTEAQIKRNYERILDNAASESPIVLTHEINEYTMDMFEEMYPRIDSAFDHVVPVTACQNITRPYTEDISYPDFASFTAGTIMPKGLPSASSIKTDRDAKYNAVPLSQMENGYANPGKSATGRASGGGDQQDDAGASSASSSSSTGSSSSAGSASTSAPNAASGAAILFPRHAAAVALVLAAAALVV